MYKKQSSEIQGVSENEYDTDMVRLLEENA